MTSRPGQYSVLVISDVHAPGEGLVLGGVDPIENLRAAFALVDASGYRPDALIFSGDISHGGHAAAYERVKSVVEPAVAKWECALLYVPGNHDHDSELFRKVLLDGAPSADQVMRLGGLRVIGLDSSIRGVEWGELTEEQLAWLRAELRTEADEGTVVVLHHQPIRTPEPVIEELGLRNRDDFARAVRGTDVRLIVSGHTHHASGGSLGGVPVWTAPSISFATDVLSTTSHRYLDSAAITRVDVFGDSVLATAIPVRHAGVALVDVTFDEVRELLSHAHGDGQPGRY